MRSSKWRSSSLYGQVLQRTGEHIVDVAVPQIMSSPFKLHRNRGSSVVSVHRQSDIPAVNSCRWPCRQFIKLWSCYRSSSWTSCRHDCCGATPGAQVFGGATVAVHRKVVDFLVVAKRQTFMIQKIQATIKFPQSNTFGTISVLFLDSGRKL